MMESRKRSFIKTISYRLLSATAGFIILFLVTGNIKVSLKAGLLMESTKVIIYYIHERIWSKIRYGLTYPIKVE